MDSVGDPRSPSMARDRVTDAENSLEKIKRQLSSGAGRSLLQGPLLKRSETLRKWNERWVTLDPATGKMEYRTRRNELTTKGTIIFDANSTITLSPVNVHGLPKYDGCCFYIGTPQKKEYFLCAETPGAAKAWVSTLRASQLVLKAHREAVNSLGGNGSTIMGTVAAAVAAANSTAKEAAKEIEAAMQISMKAALGALTNQANDKQMDNMTIMKLKDLEDKVAVLNKERENLLNQRDSASQEAHLWRGELAKARERAVIMEAALVRAEERSKYLEADTEAKVKDAIEKQLEAMKARDDALKEVSRLKSALQRLHSEAKVKELITNQNVQENLPVGTSNAEEAPETYKLDKITDANASKEAVHSTGKELVYIDENHQLGSSSSMLPQKENDSIITVVNVQSAPPSCLSSTEPQDLDATLEEPDSSQSREPEDRH